MKGGSKHEEASVLSDKLVFTKVGYQISIYLFVYIITARGYQFKGGPTCPLLCL